MKVGISVYLVFMDAERVIYRMAYMSLQRRAAIKRPASKKDAQYMCVNLLRVHANKPTNTKSGHAFRRDQISWPWAGA